ncbi:hypothetical protein ES319_D02G168300v1 [Gossypium barbadense]|uniref:Uncharacterized protein n=1 Tax=Gossypium barbadense TaxID=3634 RepID=A0A5J5SE96_GOSBA|nr:hypothetical protein ES319_D02G168300v1 [Gossypium barbadense]
MLTDDDMIFPQRALSKKMRRYKSQSIPPQFTLNCNDSNGNRELDQNRCRLPCVGALKAEESFQVCGFPIIIPG